ncbi:MAG: permease prefix domain 1-containing protein [Woeseia sp.]
MAAPDCAIRIEEQIEQWRSYLRRRQAIHSVDVEELEDHLREQVSALVGAGLSDDEAFLVSVKRMGDLDTLSREFAREHSERLWKQLVVIPGAAGQPGARARGEAVVAFCLAAIAALAVKAPELFGLRLDEDAGFYARNLSLFVLPVLTGYFVWKRGPDPATRRWMAAAFVVAAVFANVYSFSPGFSPGGYTEILTAMHLPIALWLVVGIAYAGGRWRDGGGRMDFIRFSGELFIYYVLIALGGAVLTGFMVAMFEAIGIDTEPFFTRWMLPCGALGAVVIGSWLVEAKQSVIENMAPVLTRLFTPLFAIVLLAFLATMTWIGRGIDFHRDMIIAFDLLLAVVLGLLLYSISARDPRAAPDAFDVLQVVLVISALLVDTVALWAIATRISEFGFSPNRVAALGENVILLVNLAWSAVLYVRFLRGRGSFAGLERWQTAYLPVYAVWAAIVVIVFPPLFGYI